MKNNRRERGGYTKRAHDIAITAANKATPDRFLSVYEVEYKKAYEQFTGVPVRLRGAA